MYHDRYQTDVARSPLKVLGPYRLYTTDQPSPFAPPSPLHSHTLVFGEETLYGITFEFGEPLPLFEKDPSQQEPEL